MEVEGDAIDDDERDQVHKMEIDLRRGFIRKVYGVVLIQLAVTTVIAAIVYFSLASSLETMKVGTVIALGAVSVTLLFAATCIILCKYEWLRVYPRNYVIISCFTVSLAIAIGFMSLALPPGSVLLAMGITLVVVVGLTLFAFQARYTSLNYSLLFVVSLCVMLWALVELIVFLAGGSDNPAFQSMTLMNSFLVVMLYSMVLVVDTQRIVDGEHPQKFGIDDYAAAAFCVYIDIMRIFVELIRLLGRR